MPATQGSIERLSGAGTCQQAAAVVCSAAVPPSHGLKLSTGPKYRTLKHTTQTGSHNLFISLIGFQNNCICLSLQQCCVRIQPGQSTNTAAVCCPALQSLVGPSFISTPDGSWLQRQTVSMPGWASCQLLQLRQGLLQQGVVRAPVQDTWQAHAACIVCCVGGGWQLTQPGPHDAAALTG